MSRTPKDLTRIWSTKVSGYSIRETDFMKEKKIRGPNW